MVARTVVLRFNTANCLGVLPLRFESRPEISVVPPLFHLPFFWMNHSAPRHTTRRFARTLQTVETNSTSLRPQKLSVPTYSGST